MNPFELFEIEKQKIPREMYKAIQIETIGSAIKVFSDVLDQEFTGQDVVAVLLGAIVEIRVESNG